MKILDIVCGTLATIAFLGITFMAGMIVDRGMWQPVSVSPKYKDQDFCDKEMANPNSEFYISDPGSDTSKWYAFYAECEREQIQLLIK